MSAQSPNPSMPTEDFKETVKQQADIVRIIGDYIKLKKAGASNYSGLCPFHGEKTPSFSVHATRQFYHCFGCGVSGDVFSFVQKVENITFPEAVRLVAQKLGIPLPKATYSSPGEAKDAKLRAQLLDAQERAAAFFQECLKRPEGARAREYLVERGLDQQTIATFRIGYAPDSGFLLRDRLAGEFSEEVLRESGLFSWKEAASSEPRAVSNQGQPVETAARNPEALSPAPGDQSGDGSQLVARSSQLAAIYSKFRNRVMFPIANDAGKIIAFTGRTLATDEKSGPKYLNSPETGIYSKSRVLFNLDRAKEAIRKLDYAILVEGQMDCISVYAAGFHNVIASSGTAFTEPQAKKLRPLSKNIVVNFDPDNAGAKAAERTIGLLIQEEFQVKVLPLDQGFDPDLYIRHKGKEGYAGALRRACRYFDFLIERARTQFPIRSAEGKMQAMNFLVPHIQQIPNRIARDQFVDEIPQKLGIDAKILRQELRQVITGLSSSKMQAPINFQVTDAERILIRALATSRQVQAEGEYSSDRNGGGSFLKDDEFDPARQAQYALQSEGLHRRLATESLIDALLNASPELADVMEVECSESDRRLLASILLNEGEPLTEVLLEGAIRGLRRKHLARRLEEVQRELQTGNLRDPQQIRVLTDERVRLKLALRDPSRTEAQTNLGNQKTA